MAKRFSTTGYAEAMNDYIPYGRQDISQEDIDAVIAVLHSDWITQGPAIERFEQAVANYCEAKYAVAVSSATAALHIACLAASLGKEDIFWTSPNTFVASANCGLYCGAKVDFVDIDPNTYNLSIDELESKLVKAKKQGYSPKILIPVNFSGQSCEMEKIAALSKQYGFKIIEDASHAIGGRYQGKPIGSCQFSDMTVFSFHPVKIITTGEGGMVLTNQKELHEKLIRLRNHGITRNPNLMQKNSHGSWCYQQLELGFNYRMTDIQAALGASQMQRLNEFVEHRWFLANRYNQLLQDLPLILPWQHPDSESSWHLYVIRLKLDKINKTHRQIFEELRDAGIGVNLHYIPVHTQPYYQQLNFKWGDFPQVEKYYQEAISLPLYYSLTQENQERVVKTLQEIML
ncbi:UDP-4-amino-4,6-dideoxy-N-acetyl-beta-L-altrosamine transaminase [Calothrix sp. PCC 7507]|uniref:UDP-4-amino-4, 6-dideoxy-N-acetyl-beta-L-altrosamine transaminase n=1 Tax=Calothrix sp. PCC 7507 TaxID=99598 RepID=UPI00029F27F8|nr:UDP-4-amino-4,6-dideoxy-N-acetyl-beta-L-altrosamine transaminase [Calothrix sp. PCC 7507]AFY35686.1 UDP-4-keto-6-deoxy-N-acetylglucosamine4-aminotra nsferase [Calothrix sp. PCC 7507]